MTPHIIIVGNSADYHASAIAWALRQVNSQVLLWDGFSSELHGSFSYETANSDQSKFVLAGENIVTIKSLWFRRPIPFVKKPLAGENSAKFLKNEISDGIFNVHALLKASSTFIVGDLWRTEWYSKAMQLELARRVGFNVPTTLITNCPEQVAEFRKKNGSTIIKHFTPHFFINESEKKYRSIGPRLISVDFDLPEKSIKFCPAIYQAYVDKDYELRVTIIGSKIFPVMISSHSSGGYFDWRSHCYSEDFQVREVVLSEALEALIKEYINTLGIKYGCIDIGIDKEGKAHFFEINLGGQFLFIDNYVDYNLLNCFSSMLLAGNVEYDLISKPNINIKEFERSEAYFEHEKMKSQLNLSHQHITYVSA